MTLPLTSVAGPPAAPAPAPPALDRVTSVVRPALDRAVTALHPALRAPTEHHLAGGGKGVRATIAVLAATACGAAAAVGVPGAVAVELVHNFSLVHDDVMDNDIERRHRPTVWAAFGVGPAIVTGDALSTLALQVLLEEPTTERVAAALVLARATQEMIAGQALDLAFESRSRVSLEECLAMVQGKTAALLAGAVELGAVLAGAPEPCVRALRDFGTHLGVAFQAVDDVLGIWGDSSVTGKPVGSDLLAGKKSLPIAAVVDRSDPATATAVLERLAGPLDDAAVVALSSDLEVLGGRAMTMQLAEAHLAAAIGALERTPIEPGPAAELAEIARYTVERNR